MSAVSAAAADDDDVLQWPDGVPVPETVLSCIMSHLGVVCCVQAGYAGVSRRWRRVLWDHADWESVCDGKAMYHVTRSDGTRVHWGRYFLSGAESEATQLNIMCAVLRGENIFITGEGGCGKTMLLDLIATQLRKSEVRVHVTATTALAATLISGTTLHRWAGLGLAKGTVAELLSSMRRDVRERWTHTDVLVIDECSMLDSELVGKLDLIGQRLRGNGRFFGGIQLIFSGDFFQLAPVRPSGLYQFAFQMPQFESGVDHVFVLKHNHRSTDAQYTELLGRVRSGDHTVDDVALLETRLQRKLDDGSTYHPLDGGDAALRGVLPTRLHARRIEVQEFNSARLAELKGNEIEFRAVAGARSCGESSYYSAVGPAYSLAGASTALSQFEASCAVYQSMRYKIGAQVVLVVNISPDRGLVNGSRGVVTDTHRFTNAVQVRFANGEHCLIHPHTWHQKEVRGDHGQPIDFCYSQMPLALAWAVTVHKVNFPIQGAPNSLGAMC